MRDGLEIIEMAAKLMVDSQGFDAVELELVLENGAHGKAAVPLMGESDNVRDRKRTQDNIKHMECDLIECVLFEDVSDQHHIDSLLWDTFKADQSDEMRSMVLACSMAAARAAGAGMGIPLYQYLGGIVGRELPLPMMNMIHGSRIEGYGIDVAEVMVVPGGAVSFKERLRMGTEIYHTLKRLLDLDGRSSAAGDDGSFSGKGMHVEEALELIVDAGKLCGYEAGTDFSLALNMGAEQIYDRDNSLYQFEGEGHLNGLHIERDYKEMIGYYLRLIDGFPIRVLEGIMADEDEHGWMLITKTVGHRVTILGDSIFHTDGQCLVHGMGSHLAGGLVVTLGEAGTVSRALSVCELARQGGYQVAVSHQGRETEDPFLSAFAVAAGSGYIKVGAPCRGERTAKYNELLRLEEFFSGKCH